MSNILEKSDFCFGSVCSGVGAASVAWNPLGWKAAWFSEIEPFPCAVLSHHFPDVPNYGDMTLLPSKILSREVEAPDMLCGGTPCQAFSVAGLRKSLDDARGNLSLTFIEIADAIDAVRTIQSKRACIVFWENVPGVLNTKDNAFGCFLGGLVGADAPLSPQAKRWPNSGFVTGPKRKAAWRILDAQYFGVPQRRRRVFVVASSTQGGVDPSKILFERKGVPGNSESSGAKGKDSSTVSEDGSGSNGTKVGTLVAGYGRCYNALQSVDQLVVDGYREGSFGTFQKDSIAATIKAFGGCLGGGSETILAELLER